MSDPPPPSLREKHPILFSKLVDLKGWAALVVAITGLVVALRESGARASYTESSKAIETEQENARRNHEAIEAQRAWFESYMKEHEAVVVPVVVDAGASEPFIAAPARPRDAGAPVVVKVHAAPTATPPPAAPPLQAQAKLRSYDSL
jgi:hypothetical protein